MSGIKTSRRNRIRAQPYPESWRVILERNVPYYGRLPVAQQAELRGDIQVFIAEKKFEGCGGLEITDEMRVTIAAFACILLLNRPHDFYPRLQSILVYPDAYVAKTVQPGPPYTLVEGHEVRLGESWHTGAVVIAWNHVLRQPSEFWAGRNLVLHEFAHQLDTALGQAHGAPPLPKTSMYSAWARILGREFKELTEAVRTAQPTFINQYGATNPAEFFAVVTEHFFEAPQQLKECHPELYAELQLYYQQDPAAL